MTANANGSPSWKKDVAFLEETCHTSTEAKGVSPLNTKSSNEWALRTTG